MKNILRVVNGDRLSFDLKLTLNNEEYILGLGEKVWFTVYDGENLEDTNIKLNIVQEETTKIDIPSIDLEPGDYNFDVGIIFTDGTTKTLLANQRNYRNVLRVLPKGCNNKSVTGVIFEDAFNAEIYDCNHGCYDTVRLYKLLDDLSKRAFISVDTIEERDSIPTNKLSNGKIVRVNNVDGEVKYYLYNNSSWEDFVGSYNDLSNNPTINNIEVSGDIQIPDIFSVNESTTEDNKKTISISLDDTSFFREIGTVGENYAWYTDPNLGLSMVGNYELVGDFCYLTVTCPLMEGWNTLYYSLPVASTFSAAVIARMNDRVYTITTNSIEDTSALEIKDINGSPLPSGVIHFTISYKYK